MAGKKPYFIKMKIKTSYLIFEGVQGSVSGSIFKTLSKPAMNGPVTEIPAVRTVSKPQNTDEGKTTYN